MQAWATFPFSVINFIVLFTICHFLLPGYFQTPNQNSSWPILISWIDKSIHAENYVSVSSYDNASLLSYLRSSRKLKEKRNLILEVFHKSSCTRQVKSRLFSCILRWSRELNTSCPQKMELRFAAANRHMIV